MSDTEPTPQSAIEQIDLRTVEEWQTPPRVEFDKVASLAIAKWVLWIFAGIYVCAFAMIWKMLSKEDATFTNVMDILKFLIQSVLPLVTLAVGYYLGDRTSISRTNE